MSSEDIPLQVITGWDNTTYYNNETVIFPFTYYDAEDIRGLLNVTTKVPLKYAIPLFGYIMPVLLLITIITNTLIVVVLAQKQMRSPTNLVLLAIGISDLLMLLFPVPWHFYMYTLDNHCKPLSPTVICYAYHSMIQTFPALFHTASIWLTLLLAAQRYICVRHPFMARIWCTAGKVRQAMAWIFITALLHQSTRLFDSAFESIQVRWRDKLYDGCVLKSADWVQDIITEDVYFSVYYGFRIMFVLIVPCLALVILNVLLLCTLRNVRRPNLSEETFQRECPISGGNTRRALMLIVVITVFLAIEIPLSVTYLLHILNNLLRLHIAEYDTLNTTISFLSFFLNLGFTTNIAIYCAMSSKFKGAFKDLFLNGYMVGGISRYFLANGPRINERHTLTERSKPLQDFAPNTQTNQNSTEQTTL